MINTGNKPKADNITINIWGDVTTTDGTSRKVKHAGSPSTLRFRDEPIGNQPVRLGAYFSASWMREVHARRLVCALESRRRSASGRKAEGGGGRDG